LDVVAAIPFLPSRDPAAMAEKGQVGIE
jgi:hypothetical protein